MARAPCAAAVGKMLKGITMKFKLVNNKDKGRNNEKKIHMICMENGKFLSVTQIAGFFVRRISSDKETPKKVLAGQYLGIIKFGSRVDLCFPVEGFKLKIHEGQKIDIGDKIGQYNFRNFYQNNTTS